MGQLLIVGVLLLGKLRTCRLLPPSRRPNELTRLALDDDQRTFELGSWQVGQDMHQQSMCTVSSHLAISHVWKILSLPVFLIVIDALRYGMPNVARLGLFSRVGSYNKYWFGHHHIGASANRSSHFTHTPVDKSAPSAIYRVGGPTIRARYWRFCYYNIYRTSRLGGTLCLFLPENG